MDWRWIGDGLTMIWRWGVSGQRGDPVFDPVEAAFQSWKSSGLVCTFGCSRKTEMKIRAPSRIANSRPTG
jgi:hypothetical protein